MEIIADKDRSSLLGSYSRMRDMECVPRDARHHAEGDVPTHTRMMLAECGAGASSKIPQIITLYLTTQGP